MDFNPSGAYGFHTFGQWDTADREAVEQADRELATQVSSHMDEAALFEGLGGMGITERKALSQQDEVLILSRLCALQQNPQENLQEVLCQINKMVMPDICRFPNIAKKLKEIAVPIIQCTLDEQVPGWNRIIRDELESIQNDQKIAAVLIKLNERSFPCHGLGELLMQNKIIYFDGVTKEFSEEKIPIYDALCHIDPVGDACQLGLALCHTSSAQKRDSYLLIKSLLENVVYNGSSDECRDVACVNLSTLLQNGAEGCPPDLAEAKNVLQKLISGTKKIETVFRSVRALDSLLSWERCHQRSNPYGREERPSGEALLREARPYGEAPLREEREDADRAEDRHITSGRYRSMTVRGKGGRW